MCAFKVGDQVHYSPDPNTSHIYVVTAVYSNIVCTYDIRLIVTPFTVYTNVPQAYIQDSLEASTSSES